MADRVLLDWYAPRSRLYPWRGERDPYRILVSEIMLQQTQAARVAAAYPRFLARFPTLRSLAAAPQSEVVRAWAGLGYNRRAAALSRTARIIVAEHGGRVPRDRAALERLPGVGVYTAAAVSTFAFGMRTAAIDTNVRRVTARSRLGREAHEISDAELAPAVDRWLAGNDPRAWTQAVMDLGRDVCRPRPRCEACPIAQRCRFRRAGRTPAPAPRRQGRFEGSARQARGRMIGALRDSPSASLDRLAKLSGIPLAGAASIVRDLRSEGLVAAGDAALAGRPLGRVRLAAD